MRARATPAADRPGEVAGAAVSNRPVRASTISGDSARPISAKGRVTFSKRDHARSEVPVQRATAPAPASAPKSAAEEEAAKRSAQAQKLLDLLPDRALPVAGGQGSRLPAESYEAAALLFLSNTGGKSSDAVKGLRLFITDFARFVAQECPNLWNGDPKSIWPVSLADALACRDWLRESGCDTAAERVPRALEFARDTLNLPVPPFDRAAFNERIARRQKNDKARRAPPPLLIKYIRDAACEPPPGTTEAVCEKYRELYVDVLGSSRGGGFHASRIIPPVPSDPDRPADVWHLCCIEDKLQRQDVHQWVPQLDIVTGEPLGPWASDFVVARAGLEFVITDWVDAAPNKRSVADASVVKLDDTGRPSFAVKDRATGGLVDVVPIAAGLPMADLKALRISGTHPYRHFAGEVSELLGWPEKEANILGDWTTSTAEADGSFKPGARAPKGSSGTRKKWYAVEASRAQQIRARTRFVQAVAAGYELFGLDNLNWSTTWLDIFPQPAPPELEAFYGPDKNPPKYRVPKRPALPAIAGSSSPAPGSAPSAKRARTTLAIAMKPSPATSPAALGRGRRARPSLTS
jgi:hypothetical protein